MKKVLIVTYYWPPAGGSGVQRWLKMSKYLWNYGWEPVIFTAENGEPPVFDETLQKEVRPQTEVHKVPIWEPYTVYKRFTGKKKGEKMAPGLKTTHEKNKLANKMAVWIRGNVFIPDARMFWIRPSRKYLKNYLKENHVDAIISTGPPHSTHLIAMKVAKKFNIPWIADFRDPWTNIDFYHKLNLSFAADRIHRKLEKKVLKSADKVVTVSWSWGDDFKGASKDPIEIITNGFDAADFENLPTEILSQSFSISHYGAMNEDRNPRALWKVLKKLNAELQGFKEALEIRLVGSVDSSIIETYTQEGIADNVKITPHINHSEVVQQMRTSQILFLAINDTPNSFGIVPGKIYEYIGAKRPILAVGPTNADSSKIIKDTNAGEIFGFEDEEGIEAYLRNAFEAYKSGTLSVQADPEKVKKYTREAGAQQYSHLLNKIA